MSSGWSLPALVGSGAVDFLPALSERQFFVFEHTRVTTATKPCRVINRQSKGCAFLINMLQSLADHLISVIDKFQLSTVQLFPALGADVMQDHITIGYPVWHAADWACASEDYIGT